MTKRVSFACMCGHPGRKSHDCTPWEVKNDKKLVKQARRLFNLSVWQEMFLANMEVYILQGRPLSEKQRKVLQWTADGWVPWEESDEDGPGDMEWPGPEGLNT